jgi:hypothetical protein
MAWGADTPETHDAAAAPDSTRAAAATTQTGTCGISTLGCGTRGPITTARTAAAGSPAALAYARSDASV